MNALHILGITFLLLGTSQTIEEPKSKIQKVLLRKLQSEPQEIKPLMWNEVLADVLVNKIRIFSFNKQTNSQAPAEAIKEDKTPEISAVTNFVSEIFFVYKKFVYDYFAKSKIASDGNSAQDEDNLITTIDIQNDRPDKETREADDQLEITPTSGPKGEVELVEPRYHGLQVLGNGTGESSGEESDDNEGESVDGCPEGTVKVDDNKCVNSSRLILAIPRQCPIGYRLDRTGYCRLRF